MKKILFYLLVFVGISFVSGCDDNDDPAGVRGVGIVPGITDVNPAIFNSKDLENAFVEFKLSLEEGVSADEATIVGSYNGDGARKEITKVTSFPSTVKITTTEAASILGVSLDALENDDLFTFEVLVRSGDRVNTSNSVLNVRVACPFDATLTIGTYAVVSDDWGTSGELTLTADPQDPYTIYVVGLATIDGLNEDKGPLVMKINPLSYEVVAPKAVLATDYFGYDNGAFEGKGTFNSCDGSYNMDFSITVDQGSFGTFKYVMTRKDE